MLVPSKVGDPFSLQSAHLIKYTQLKKQKFAYTSSVTFHSKLDFLLWITTNSSVFSWEFFLQFFVSQQHWDR